MAITSITADLTLPVAGDTVTFSATATPFFCETGIGTANQFRFKLISKPLESSLELFDDAKENYLVANKFTPDVDGMYTFTCNAEMVSTSVPHFSNDGSTGGYKGLERTTLLATATVYYPVGGTLTRQLGVAPDTCQISVTTGRYPCIVWSTGSPSAIPTEGVITDYADATRAPALSDGTTDKAKLAMQAAAVSTALAAIGGDGYTGTSTILSWSSVIDSDPVATLTYLLLAFNDHVTSTNIATHYGADVTNPIATADCTVGDATSQVNLLNDIRTAGIAHYACTSSGGHSVHSTADVTNTLPASDLAGGASLADRMARANLLTTGLMAHYKFGAQPVAGTPVTYGYVHPDVGDWQATHSTPDATTEATLVARANEIKSVFNAHLGRGQLGVAYHVDSGVLGSQYFEDFPSELGPAFVAAVNKYADLLQAHATNIKATDGTAETYHTTADWDARTDDLPRATDDAGAIQLLEILHARFFAHVAKGVNVHDRVVTITRSWWGVAQSGIGLLNGSFVDAVNDAAATVPPTESEATTKLIQLGGFVKA